MLLAFGYLALFQQYFTPNQLFLDNVGDIIRLVGLVSLLAAVLAG